MKFIKIKPLNTLAIVSTQFQLLNAIEFSKGSIKKEKLNLIILILNNNHEKQMNYTAEKYNAKIIYSVKFEKYIQYFDLTFKLIKLKINYTVDNLVVGHIKNNMILFCIKFIKFKKLNLVDDGEILEVKNQKPSINKKYWPINYYSIFNLTSNKFFHFYKNEYQTLRLNKIKPSNNKTLFIGSPLVEHNIVPEKLFFSIINKVLLKEKQIDYLMHPREKYEKFNRIKNINYFLHESGVEQYLLESDLIPSKIISFYSTAMTSIRLILNQNEKNLYFIDLRKYCKSNDIRDVEYDYLKNNCNEYILN